MEIVEAKNYTVLILRIEEDLDMLKEALHILASTEMWGATQKATMAKSLLKAIENCNRGKDIELRFT